MEPLPPRERRRLRRLRLRRRGGRAMLRGVHLLPAMATLGNALCGFGAVYVATLAPGLDATDPLTEFLARNPLLSACYLLVFAALFDAIDGRLARITRHTTDFGGQLDSLADVLSFGAAPAFLALTTFKLDGPQHVPVAVSRLVWAVGAIYVACALIRLARFNVVNEHAEQAHKTFVGLPSPGAGLAVASLVLLHVQLVKDGLDTLAYAVVLALPAFTLAAALLMVSPYRFPHLFNTVLGGRRSPIGVIVIAAVVLLGLLYLPYTGWVVAWTFALLAPGNHLVQRWRARRAAP